MRRIMIAALVAGALTACGPRAEDAGTAGGTTTTTTTTATTAAPSSPAAGVTPIPQTPAGGMTSPSPALGSGDTADGSTSGASQEDVTRSIFPGAAQVVSKDLDLGGHGGEHMAETLGHPLEGHDTMTPALVATSSDGRSLGATWSTDAHLTGDETATVTVGMGLDGKIQRVVVQGAQTSPGFLEWYVGKTVAELGGAKAEDATSKEIASSVRRAAIVLQDGLIAPPKHEH